MCGGQKKEALDSAYIQIGQQNQLALQVVPAKGHPRKARHRVSILLTWTMLRRRLLLDGELGDGYG